MDNRRQQSAIVLGRLSLFGIRRLEEIIRAAQQAISSDMVDYTQLAGLSTFLKTMAGLVRSVSNLSTGQTTSSLLNLYPRLSPAFDLVGDTAAYYHWAGGLYRLWFHRGQENSAEAQAEWPDNGGLNELVDRRLPGLAAALDGLIDLLDQNSRSYTAEQRQVLIKQLVPTICDLTVEYCGLTPTPEVAQPLAVTS